MEFAAGLIYLAVHLDAALLAECITLPVEKVRILGGLAWCVPAAVLALLALDWSGRVRVSGPVGMALAALALPRLCGTVEALARLAWLQSPEAWGWYLSLLLLAGYILLRERDGGEASLDLLERGSALGAAEAVWLLVLGGSVLFLATVGMLFTIILGGLFASRNSLWDYEGFCGVLSGLLALHLLQSVLFWRGWRLARETAPEFEEKGFGFTLFVPVWNQVQARRLARRLQLRGVKDYY